MKNKNIENAITNSAIEASAWLLGGGVFYLMFVMAKIILQLS